MNNRDTRAQAITVKNEAKRKAKLNISPTKKAADGKAGK